MQLPTYPRLNLPSKKLGIESSDWIWVGAGLVPGAFSHSTILMIIVPGAIYFYMSQIKPKYPKGWVTYYLQFLSTRKKVYVAMLERKK